MSAPLRSLHVASFAATLLMLSPALAGAQSTTFRVADMDLRDPHVFVDFLGCNDLTDNSLGGFSFNAQLQAQIQQDGDGDGELDLSLLLSFMPLAQAQPANFLAFGTGACNAPFASTTCGGIQTPAFAGDVALDAAVACLDPVPGTVRPYTPAITSAAPACFASPAFGAVLRVADIPLPLSDVQVAATFQGDPATGLVNGLLRGFVSQADADSTLLPASYPLVGGQPLSSLLPGGTGNCAGHSDMDTNGVAGWWFYFNFSAVEVPDPFENGFHDGFEG